MTEPKKKPAKKTTSTGKKPTSSVQQGRANTLTIGLPTSKKSPPPKVTRTAKMAGPGRTKQGPNWEVG